MFNKSFFIVIMWRHTLFYCSLSLSSSFCLSLSLSLTHTLSLTLSLTHTLSLTLYLKIEILQWMQHEKQQLIKMKVSNVLKNWLRHKKEKNIHFCDVTKRLNFVVIYRWEGVDQGRFTENRFIVGTEKYLCFRFNSKISSIHIQN